MNMDLIYRQLDQLLENGRIEETEDFLIAALRQAQQEGDYNSLIALLNEMAGYQKEIGKPDKALAYGAQAIELMKRLHMTETAVFGTTLLNVANACRDAGKLPEAYQLYMEAFPVFEKHFAPDDVYYASLYKNLGLLFQETEEYERAVECLERALAVIQGKPQLKEQAMVIRQQIDRLLAVIRKQQQEQFDRQEAYYREQRNEAEEVKKEPTREELAEALIHMECEAFRQIRENRYADWDVESLKEYIYEFKMTQQQGVNPLALEWADKNE